MFNIREKKLDQYYKARKLSDMYNSEENRIEFKLAPKDLMMMDNHRVLHGRTKYDPSEVTDFYRVVI